MEEASMRWRGGRGKFEVARGRGGVGLVAASWLGGVAWSANSSPKGCPGVWIQQGELDDQAKRQHNFGLSFGT